MFVPYIKNFNWEITCDKWNIMSNKRDSLREIIQNVYTVSQNWNVTICIDTLRL